jgi:hypothetical protein
MDRFDDDGNPPFVGPGGAAVPGARRRLGQILEPRGTSTCA